MGKTDIEWADRVWNPLAGCSIVSAGCKNCYAMRMAHRLEAMGQEKYAGLTQQMNGRVVWNGRINLDEGSLDEPLRRKSPTRYFVNSMSDLFHPNVPEAFIHRVFTVMRRCKQHVFMILTKRAGRMLDVVRSLAWRSALPGEYGWQACRGDPGSHVLDNVWLGVSVEDQPAADERVPLLLGTPAAVRFLSCEPLLGPVSLTDQEWWDWRYAYGFYPSSVKRPIDLVIAGGESGVNARPMHPDWVRGLRDQCVSAWVKFHFKQWGQWAPVCHYYEEDDTRREAALDAPHILLTREGVLWNLNVGQPPPSTWMMRKMDKRTAGRELDGRMWDELPVQKGISAEISAAEGV
ncbi:MAG: phage Gp37/Gp68 family protein [Chloroflexi bacterium]|nr:phage Gp37/Gp68 family protein [Chloroflexota bacterium]